MLLSKFILVVKINRAEDLLKIRSDLNIRNISKQVGFIKIEQFRQYFRARTGLNPSKYRRYHQN